MFHEKKSIKRHTEHYHKGLGPWWLLLIEYEIVENRHYESAINEVLEESIQKNTLYEIEKKNRKKCIGIISESNNINQSQQEQSLGIFQDESHEINNFQDLCDPISLSFATKESKVTRTSRTTQYFSPKPKTLITTPVENMSNGHQKPEPKPSDASHKTQQRGVKRRQLMLEEWSSDINTFHFRFEKISQNCEKSIQDTTYGELLNETWNSIQKLESELKLLLNKRKKGRVEMSKFIETSRAVVKERDNIDNELYKIKKKEKQTCSRISDVKISHLNIDR